MLASLNVPPVADNPSRSFSKKARQYNKLLHHRDLVNYSKGFLKWNGFSVPEKEFIEAVPGIIGDRDGIWDESTGVWTYTGLKVRIPRSVIAERIGGESHATGESAKNYVNRVRRELQLRQERLGICLLDIESDREKAASYQDRYTLKLVFAVARWRADRRCFVKADCREGDSEEVRREKKKAAAEKRKAATVEHYKWLREELRVSEPQAPDGKGTPAPKPEPDDDELLQRELHRFEKTALRIAEKRGARVALQFQSVVRMETGKALLENYPGFSRDESREAAIRHCVADVKRIEREYGKEAKLEILEALQGGGGGNDVSIYETRGGTGAPPEIDWNFYEEEAPSDGLEPPFSGVEPALPFQTENEDFSRVYPQYKSIGGTCLKPNGDNTDFSIREISVGNSVSRIETENGAGTAPSSLPSPEPEKSLETVLLGAGFSLETEAGTVTPGDRFRGALDWFASAGAGRPLVVVGLRDTDKRVVFADHPAEGIAARGEAENWLRRAVNARASLCLRMMGSPGEKGDEVRPLIQVDDCTRVDVERLAGVSGAVFETSPGSYQCWLALDGPALPQGALYRWIVSVRDEFFRGLGRVNANPGAYGSLRFPGSRNFKPERKLPDGSFPLVRMIASRPGFLKLSELEAAGFLPPGFTPDTSGGGPSPDGPPFLPHVSLPKEGLPVVDEAPNYPSMEPCLERAGKNANGKYDTFRADFHYCLDSANALPPRDAGYIAACLLLVSEKARRMGARYAFETASKAKRFVEERKAREALNAVNVQAKGTRNSKW